MKQKDLFLVPSSRTRPGALADAINAAAVRRRRLSKRATLAPRQQRIAVLGGASTAAELTRPAL